VSPPNGAEPKARAEQLSQQESRGNERDVHDRRRDAVGDILDFDVLKPRLLERSHEVVELRKLLDRPITTDAGVAPAEEIRHRIRALQEAVGDEESCAGLQKPRGFTDELGLIRSCRVTGAFNCLRPVVGCIRKRRRSIVAMNERNGIIDVVEASQISSPRSLPTNDGQTVNPSSRPLTDNQPRRCAETATQVRQANLWTGQPQAGDRLPAHLIDSSLSGLSPARQ
jgi:hypothetical protein